MKGKNKKSSSTTTSKMVSRTSPAKITWLALRNPALSLSGVSAPKASTNKVTVDAVAAVPENG